MGEGALDDKDEMKQDRGCMKSIDMYLYALYKMKRDRTSCPQSQKSGGMRIGIIK